MVGCYETSLPAGIWTETNVEVGMLYLQRLKGMLESQALFSYPRLTASYRYGYGALRKEVYG